MITNSSEGSVLLAVALSLFVADAARAGNQAGLFTQYAVLVGTPDAASSSVSVLVPGTVILSEPELNKYSVDLADVKSKLKSSYRLASLDTFANTGIQMLPGREYDVAPGADLNVVVTLIAFDDQTATFGVRLVRRGQKLAEPVVKIKHGGRAIVGTDAAPTTPYVFVLLSLPPSRAATGPAGTVGPAGIQMPRVLVEKKPQYTPELLKEKAAAHVVTTCVVLPDGRTSGHLIARSSDPRFNALALEALKGWVFEPGRDASGKPVSVSVTIEFTFTAR